MIEIITNIDTNKGITTLNCNSNLIHYVIKTHDPLWFDFRYAGIKGVYEGGFGASEASALMRVTPENYAPVLPQLMEWKAGITIPERKMTEAMLSGILAEPTILERWMYYDGTDMGYLNNYLANDKKRDCYQVRSYIVNKRMPWLFVSLDSAIKKGYSTLDGEVLAKDSPLEAKTIGFMAAKAHEHGIPISYIYQVQTQCLVTETDYAEIAILEGGNKFRVIPVPFQPEIAEAILEKSYEAWQTVIQLRELNAALVIAKGAEKWIEVEEIQGNMQNLLPLPGAGEAYDEYYSDKFVESGNIAKGTLKQFGLIRQRSDLNLLKKRLEEEIDRLTNLFRHDFVTQGVDVIDFDKLGKVKFTKRSNGQNYFPDFKGIKEKADADRILQVYQTLQTLLNK